MREKPSAVQPLSPASAPSVRMAEPSAVIESASAAKPLRATPPSVW